MIPIAAGSYLALWQGIALGLGASVPIGPVNVEIARRALRHGYPAAQALGAGGVATDVAYGVASCGGLGPWVAGLPPAVGVALAAGGGGFLAWLGAGALRDARAAWRTGAADGSVESAGSDESVAVGSAAPATATDAPISLVRHFATGLGMNVLNPMNVVFWFGAIPAMLVGSAAGGGGGAAAAEMRAGLPWIAAGVAIGAFAWTAGFSGSLALARRRIIRADPGRPVPSRVLIAADVAGGVLLLAFAAVTVAGGARLLFPQ